VPKRREGDVGRSEVGREGDGERRRETEAVLRDWGEFEEKPWIPCL